MKAQDNRLQSAVEMAMSVLPNEIGCDDCFEYFAAYAEHLATGAPIPESLLPVSQHLERCPACMEELRYLLDAINS